MALPLVGALAVGLFSCAEPMTAADPPTSSKPPPAETSPLPATPPELVGDPDEAAAKKLIADLVAGQFAAVRSTFDEAMLAAVSEEGLREMWLTIDSQHGGFETIESTKVSDVQGYRVVLATCQFSASRIGLRLVFDKSHKLAGIRIVPPDGAAAAARPRPQHPKPPYPYEQREVLYDNPTDGSKLGGTLTLPSAAGPHPAVLLITGSGLQDRDETVFEHKPFLVIADHLTRAGFVVLRVDDRGIGKSTGDPKNATIQVNATDVEAGVAFLKNQKEVDPTRIGLIGHSEGGIIAPMVAARSKDVAFIVSLAGTGLPGSIISPMQVEATVRASGKFSEADLKQLVDAQRNVMTAVATGDDEKVKRAVREGLELANRLVPEAERLPSAKLELRVTTEAAGVMSPWFRSFVSTDPAEDWRKVRCPVLALNGELDLQVPAKANLDAIAKATKKNRRVTLSARPGLNHLFQHAKTGAVSEYIEIEETFDPETLQLMTDWLQKQAKLPTPGKGK